MAKSTKKRWRFSAFLWLPAFQVQRHLVEQGADVQFQRVARGAVIDAGGRNIRPSLELPRSFGKI